jgi:hypothetical protein
MSRSRGMSQAVADAALRHRLELLQAKSREELARLPKWSSDDTVVEGWPSVITTYREDGADGRFRIILQLISNQKPFLLLFESSQVFLRGFEVQPEGGTRLLRPEEMSSYD